MVRTGSTLPALLVLALAAPALSGCLTPRAKPPTSVAIAEARKGAGVKPAACDLGELADVSPVVATFPFDDPTLTEVGERKLATAAAWLNCHAGVPVSILPTADNHGSADHMKTLAAQRGQAVQASLRRLGAVNAIIHLMAPGAPDSLTGPHLVIQADGRGW